MEESRLLLEIQLNETFSSSIYEEIEIAESEVITLKETIESIKTLLPKCDKLDYCLAASSGTLCGIIDIFFVGSPTGKKGLQKWTDVSTRKCVEKFAGWCGWNKKKAFYEKKGRILKQSPLEFLEKHFKVPYDQTGAGDAGRDVFGLNINNHHFKSLGHNPTLLGLIFSILDQFTNSSHFVTEGELIALQGADNKFHLRGNNFISKIFFGFINWFGHLMSDVSGSSSAKGRGMGIPSPLWSWVNDIIVIKRTLGIKPSEFDKKVCETALEIYKKGFDTRFTVTQAIPVLINELIVRTFYTVRRLLGYISSVPEENRSLPTIWENIKPFGNPTIKRMLTVAHGVFCLVDIGDATTRAFVKGGGNFNVVEFFLRLNIVGIGRFSIALFQEAKVYYKYAEEYYNSSFYQQQIVIIENYISELKKLADYYDDTLLISTAYDLKNKFTELERFLSSVAIVEKRMPDGIQIPYLKNKKDIDDFFLNSK